MSHYVVTGGAGFIGSVLAAALNEAGVSPEVATEAIEANDQARVDGLRTALAVLALVTLPGLFVARAIPKTPK